MKLLHEKIIIYLMDLTFQSNRMFNDMHETKFQRNSFSEADEEE